MQNVVRNCAISIQSNNLSMSHGPEIFAEFTDDFRLTFEVDFDGMVTQPIAVTGPRASSPFGDKQLHHLESLTTSACVTRLPPTFFWHKKFMLKLWDSRFCTSCRNSNLASQCVVKELIWFDRIEIYSTFFLHLNDFAFKQYCQQSVKPIIGDSRFAVVHGIDVSFQDSVTICPTIYLQYVLLYSWRSWQNIDFRFPNSIAKKNKSCYYYSFIHEWSIIIVFGWDHGKLLGFNHK